MSAANGSAQPGALTIQIHALGGRCTICLRGELDMATAPDLELAVNGLAPGVDDLVLDIEQLSFMDSSGLHAILKAQDRCQRAGSRFALTRGSAQVQRLFELAGALDRLSVVEQQHT